MRNYFIRLSNQHETISKYILIFAAVFLIVISLPKETQFNYTFQKGKPWLLIIYLHLSTSLLIKMKANLTKKRQR